MVVQLLLEAGVDPLGNYHHNHYIPCALSVARNNAQTEVVALIERHLLSQLDANSDMVLEADKYGNTLLFRLVYHSYWLFIPSLIDRGADVDHRNHKGERPIHRSLYKWHGNSDRLTTGILLSRGAATIFGLQVDSARRTMFIECSKLTRIWLTFTTVPNTCPAVHHSH